MSLHDPMKHTDEGPDIVRFPVFPSLNAVRRPRMRRPDGEHEVIGIVPEEELKVLAQQRLGQLFDAFVFEGDARGYQALRNQDGRFMYLEALLAGKEAAFGLVVSALEAIGDSARAEALRAVQENRITEEDCKSETYAFHLLWRLKQSRSLREQLTDYTKNPMAVGNAVQDLVGYYKSVHTVHNLKEHGDIPEDHRPDAAKLYERIKQGHPVDTEKQKRNQ